MPAIASLEDLKAAHKDLLEAKNLEELKAAFKKWRKIGWKNVCKLWLQERTPEQLKGEGRLTFDHYMDIEVLPRKGFSAPCRSGSLLTALNRRF